MSARAHRKAPIAAEISFAQEWQRFALQTHLLCYSDAIIRPPNDAQLGRAVCESCAHISGRKPRRYTPPLPFPPLSLSPPRSPVRYFSVRSRFLLYDRAGYCSRLHFRANCESSVSLAVSVSLVIRGPYCPVFPCAKLHKVTLPSSSCYFVLLSALLSPLVLYYFVVLHLVSRCPLSPSSSHFLMIPRFRRSGKYAVDGI